MNRIASTLVLGALVVLASGTARAQLDPDDIELTCAFRHKVQDIDSLKKLPDAVRQIVSPGGAMADRGEPFNGGDAVEPNLPMEGFMRAVRYRDRWYVLSLRDAYSAEVEWLTAIQTTHYGRAHKIGVLFLRPAENSCRVIDAVIGGRRRLLPLSAAE